MPLASEPASWRWLRIRKKKLRHTFRVSAIAGPRNSSVLRTRGNRINRKVRMKSNNEIEPVSAEDVASAFTEVAVNSNPEMVAIVFGLMRDRLPEFVLQAHKQWYRQQRP